MDKRYYYNVYFIGLDFQNKPTEIKRFNLLFAMYVVRIHYTRILLVVGGRPPPPSTHTRARGFDANRGLRGGELESDYVLRFY